MPSEFLDDVLKENGTSEKHFYLDKHDPPRLVIRSITKNVSNILLFLLSTMMFRIVILINHHWDLNCMTRGDCFLIDWWGSMFVFAAMRYMPQRIVMMPDSASCSYSWGMGQIAFRFVVPISQIRGIYVDRMPWGKGQSSPCIGLRWEQKPFLLSQPFCFARHSDKHKVMIWAKEVSDLTGLPIIEICLERRPGANRPYHKDPEYITEMLNLYTETSPVTADAQETRQLPTAGVGRIRKALRYWR